MTFSRDGVAAYRSESVRAAEYADPHTLVTMLYDGAIERLAQARGAMERGMIQQKGERIGKAIAIVDNLRATLDADAGGELAGNLSSLYDYMLRRLLHGNLKNDGEALDEVQRLLRELRAAWVDIPEEERTARSA